MANLVNLSSTTLSKAVTASDSTVTVASTSNILKGLRLFVDTELMTVISLGVGTSVNVLRGRDGTAQCAHAYGATVLIGRGDQFYTQDPIGVPPTEVLVSPWVNVTTGTQWTAQGDAAGPGLGARWWQASVTTHSAGPLGVRTVTSTP